MRTFSRLADLGDGAAQVGRGQRVLVVDDERDTLLTLGILLRSEGYEVRMATCGSEVPDAVREFNPHFVLLDICMPDRTGYEVAAELRERHGDACPLLIAVTGYANRVDKAQAIASGFQHHIGKPCNPAALIHLLSVLKRN
jgi:CheY-like chemotaxis protein